MDHSKHTVAVIDNGLFTSIAELLAPHFEKVIYANPTQSAFEISAEHVVGKGLTNIETVKTPSAAYRRADKIDLWIFPDILYRDDQAILRKQGARVWGAGDAELLELDRLKFRELCQKLALDTVPYEVFDGFTAAEEHIKTHPGKPFSYLKTARHDVPFRGDFETLKYETWDLVEFRLREIREKMGAYAEEGKFLIEPHVDAVEVASDIYSVDGEFPEHGCFGLEIKGDCWLGKYVDYEDYPEGLREINDALGPTLRAGSCRSNCPIETRVTKDGRWLPLDPCMRFGRPSMGTQLMFANWPDIFWFGGEGKLVNPVKAFPFVAEMVLFSDHAESHPLPIKFPKEIEPYLKLSNKSKIRGRTVIAPHPRKLSMIGTLCAGGHTMKAAISNVQDMAKEVKAYRLEKGDHFEKVEEEIAKLKSYGIDY